jgi:hypothetical protein
MVVKWKVCDGVFKVVHDLKKVKIKLKGCVVR